MARFNSPLDKVRIAAPCSSDWNQMIGDERVRFCQQCNLNVYNLSGMPKREAESFIARAEGRVCVRYYRRRDGTILTENCPVGLRAIKRRVSSAASAMLSAALSFFAGLGLYAGTVKQEPPVLSNTMGTIALPVKNPVKVNIETPTAVMGEYAAGQVTVPNGEAYKVGRMVRKNTLR